MWILYAIGSAFFVGITAILANVVSFETAVCKSMRKAERALAFRISGSKCPFLTYLLLRYSSKSFTNHWSNDHCNDHFAQICRNERNDTDCKCCAYCISGLEAEPHGSECIADCSSNDHSKNLDPSLTEFVNYNTGNDCHWDETNDISASWSGKLSDSSGESGKYRKSHKSEKKIKDIADRSFLPIQKIERKINCKLVSEIGTGPIGMESGARMQVTAVIRAVTAIA